MLAEPIVSHFTIYVHQTIMQYTLNLYYNYVKLKYVNYFSIKVGERFQIKITYCVPRLYLNCILCYFPFSCLVKNLYRLWIKFQLKIIMIIFL